MKRALVDTSALIALADRDGQFHRYKKTAPSHFRDGAMPAVPPCLRRRFPGK